MVAKQLLSLFLALAPVLGCASEEQAIVDLPRIASVAALNEQILAAADKTAKQDWPGAMPILRAIIESPDFGALSADRRHALLTSASAVAFEVNDNQLAQNYSTRATALPDATLIDWQVRFYASFALPDMPDAAVALTQIAKQSPKDLEDIKDSNVIFRVLNESRTSTTAHFELLEALYGAHWKIEGRFEPSSEWRDYALALLDRRRPAEAKQVALRVLQPSVLISMRADKRFDAITKSSPEHFDIDKAVDGNIAGLREIARQSPRNLPSLIELTYALLKARRYDEVLSITERVMDEANSGETGKAAYDDVADNLIWILNNRAIALGGVGRREEELELLIRAARRPEHGELNVSQAINLGELYCDLGRPKDALLSVVDVEKVSPYGQSQLQSVRLCAALQLEDKDASAAALNFLREHQGDSRRTYESALVTTGDSDGAAVLLIQRLNDTSLRAETLQEVQIYLDPTDLSWPIKEKARFRSIVNRDDVQKAIYKVGRIESYNLRSDLP